MFCERCMFGRFSVISCGGPQFMHLVLSETADLVSF